MNYSVIKKLPAKEKIIQEYPLTTFAAESIAKNRHEIKNILKGEDQRLLLIIGPCSAWPQEAVIEYAHRLARVNHKIQNNIKLVMRVYIQKPRTTKGWTGPYNQPIPWETPDIEKGIKYTREMMLKVLKTGLPIADEALFTHNHKGFLEFLSWVAIGARSAENQEHRIFASAIDFAVGIKNPTHGGIAIGVNGVVAAQHKHITEFDEFEVRTHGNPYAHLVLRGSNKAPNYSVEHLLEVKHYMDYHQIQNPSVIIDASHDNCYLDGIKNHRAQPDIILKILFEIQKHPDLKKLVKGFMLESFIKDGNQNIDINNLNTINFNGLSITDPCLGWEETEHFLLTLASNISK